MYVWAFVCVAFVCNDFVRGLRLVHPDGSLADLTMLSASSVDAALPREDEEPLEKQEDLPGEWSTEKEQEQALVVVTDDPEKPGGKPKSLSDQRQSSTEESHHCSAGTEPEPSTEQSSGTEQVHKFTPKHPLLSDC